MSLSLYKRKNLGFSMIEILTVVAILAILIIMAITALPKQLEKARDSKRKADLQKIKISFEHYYNDNGCYPSAAVLENCGGISPVSHDLSPYLQNIPCDPKDESYYLYAPYDNSGGADTCDGFRVWTNLEKNDDPVISTLNCDGALGCGAYSYFGEMIESEAIKYNYGVSEGVPVAADYILDLVNGYCCAGVCNAWSSGSGSCMDGPYVDYDQCVSLSVCTN